MEKQLLIKSPDDMFQLGVKIGYMLEADSFISLYGELGAGKSIFARGVGKAFGIDSLPSPTFTIVQEYPCDPPLFHFDVYRIASEEELWGIGFDDYLSRKGIILMEWANLVPGCLPKDHLDIFIERESENIRSLLISSTCTKYFRIIDQL